MKRMFGLFKEKYFLGIDFGTTSVKAVELRSSKNGLELVNFGVADIGDGEQEENGQGTREDMRGQYFSALLERMRVHTKEVYVSVPGSSGLVFVVDVPRMGKMELAEAIRFEAHKYIPVDLEEVSINWDVLKSVEHNKTETRDTPAADRTESKTGDKTEMQEVLLAAAFKKDIQRSISTVEKSGCSVGAMELEIFSLARALVGQKPGTHLIVDMGFHSSNLVLVNEGNVYASRGVDVGGGDITKTIADGMNIGCDRAEALKKDRDFFHQKEIPLSFLSLESVINEVRRMQASFEKKKPGKKIDSILLSGGTALLPGLDTYFTEQLKISTSIGDPWSNVRYDERNMNAQTRKETGVFLSVAIGIALRSLENK